MLTEIGQLGYPHRGRGIAASITDGVGVEFRIWHLKELAQAVCDGQSGSPKHQGSELHQLPLQKSVGFAELRLEPQTGIQKDQKSSSKCEQNLGKLELCWRLVLSPVELFLCEESECGQVTSTKAIGESCALLAGKVRDA